MDGDNRKSRQTQQHEQTGAATVASEAEKKLGHITARSQSIAFTAQLLTLLSDTGNIVDRLKRVAELMEEDEQRMEDGQPPLIDLNLVDPTTGRDVIMGSTQLGWDALGADSQLNAEQRDEAGKQFDTAIWPYMLKLLDAGEYGVKRKDKDGWTAFTLLASCWIFKEGNSSYILAERLLHLGASVDERAPTNGATLHHLIHLPFLIPIPNCNPIVSPAQLTSAQVSSPLLSSKPAVSCIVGITAALTSNSL